MPATRKLIDRDKIAEARQLYERTLVPVDDIAALLGISRRTLTGRIPEWKWKQRKTGAREISKVRASPTPGEKPKLVRKAVPRKGAGEPPQAPAERVALIERMQKVVEREIDAVEQVLTTLGASDRLETEGAARTLASLARTLRELAQLDTAPPAETNNDHSSVRDLDEFRRDLSRRLDRIISDAKAVCPEPAAGG
jgi:hypothetical protein